MHGRPLGLDQIDRPMTDLPEAGSAALLLVVSIEVVSADDARAPLAGNRISIGVVRGRALRSPRDLVVDHPSPQGIAVRVHAALRQRRALFVFALACRRNVDTSVPIGKRATWTDRAKVRSVVCGVGRKPAQEVGREPAREVGRKPAREVRSRISSLATVCAGPCAVGAPRERAAQMATAPEMLVEVLFMTPD